jgi:type VI secretion system protein VasD
MKATMALAASADVNPNDQERPSPIVVRVYQLRTDGAFKSAAFVALYEDERMVLGQELIRRDEYQLKPGERRSIDVRLSNETRFVGAVAAFHRIGTAQWRALLPSPKQGLTVAVERERIVLSATD